MADAVADRLTAFLERFDGKPVEWGHDDCSACPALWVRENGYDVQLPAYSSHDEAHALIDAASGLAEIWGKNLAAAGVSERYLLKGDIPQLGDVAIIDTRRLGQVGVICGAGGICCWRKEGGFFWLAPRSYVKVWAIS